MSNSSAGDAERVQPTAWDWGLALLAGVLWMAVIRPGPLSLPYFWDEADVYVPGAIWLAENGLNITPAAFPDEYSRGHPSLFYLLVGAFFWVFGTSPAVGHLVVLPMAALALAMTYLLGTLLYGRAVGVVSFVVLGATPLFMTMGNMVLPEMPLTTLGILAIYAYARGRLGWAMVAGVAMVWMKETGIFVPLALACGVVFDGWSRGEGWSRRTLRQLALCALPALALVLFFVWQRLSAGYFVFPHHQNLFWDRPLGWENLVTVFPSTLFWHGRWVVTVLVLGALLGSWFYPSRSTGLNLASPDRPWSPRIQSISVVVLALLMGNAVFFAKMFWLERYALPVHPGLIVVMLGGISVHLFRSATEWRRGLALGTVVGLGVAMGLLGLYGEADPDEEEHTFAYADVIRTHQRVVELLEANAQHDHRVLTTWPLTVELSDPRLGYVQRPWEAVHVARYDPADETPIGAIVVNPASTHADALRSEAGKRGFSPMDPVRVGHAQSMELYLP